METWRSPLKTSQKVEKVVCYFQATTVSERPSSFGALPGTPSLGPRPQQRNPQLSLCAGAHLSLRPHGSCFPDSQRQKRHILRNSNGNAEDTMLGKWGKQASKPSQGSAGETSWRRG